MGAELLSTKLVPPRHQGQIVSREGLLSQLEAGLERKLTLVAAPAGSGKSTLVSDWSRQHSAAWVSLDVDDNDPVRFWRYVLTACNSFTPTDNALNLLNHAPKPVFESVLTVFINDLASQTGRCVLVLDDYHFITSPHIHKSMSFLLDHQPASLHIVMLTRATPPLPFARLRARNQLMEINHLRFSPEEIRTFFQTFALSDQALERLETRTEGWAVGLRLVALALQDKKDSRQIQRFIDTFAGNHRHISQYLIAEVFALQAEPIQEFLLQTAFLTRLTGDLCNAVTDRQDSQQILDDLEHANLFLIPLDDGHYRYHALFAEALQTYARERWNQTQISKLYARASHWYDEHGFSAEAIEMALKGQDFERAAALIARSTPLSNEYHTLRRWVEQLPEPLLQEYPAICFNYSLALLFTSDRRAPETAALIDRTLRFAEQHWRDHHLGMIFTLRSMVAWWQGNFLETFAALHHALELLDEGDRVWRSICILNIGAEHYLMGQPDAALPFLEEARLTNENNPHGIHAAILVQAYVFYQQGDLSRAEQQLHYLQPLVDRSIEFIDDQAEIRVTLAALAYEHNDLANAAACADHALDLAGRIDAEDTLTRASMIRARIMAAKGEIQQAKGFLQSVTNRLHHPIYLRQIRAGQAWLSLTTGEISPAQHWYSHLENLPDLHTHAEREALITARLLIAQGETHNALKLLNHWESDARQHGRKHSELEMMILKALAYAPTRRDHAHQSLRLALSMAYRQNVRRLFLDEGQTMAVMLKDLLPDIADEPCAIFARLLLLDFAGSIREEEVIAKPLSSQEQRVLRLLAAGLSNPEIADHLVVSINTVKTQIKSIYRKLNITTREEAADLARHLR